MEKATAIKPNTSMKPAEFLSMILEKLNYYIILKFKKCVNRRANCEVLMVKKIGRRG
jgi:hypothetical protein